MMSWRENRRRRRLEKMTPVTPPDDTSWLVRYYSNDDAVYQLVLVRISPGGDPHLASAPFTWKTRVRALSRILVREYEQSKGYVSDLEMLRERAEHANRSAR